MAKMKLDNKLDEVAVFEWQGIKRGDIVWCLHCSGSFKTTIAEYRKSDAFVAKRAALMEKKLEKLWRNWFFILDKRHKVVAHNDPIMGRNWFWQPIRLDRTLRDIVMLTDMFVIGRIDYSYDYVVTPGKTQRRRRFDLRKEVMESDQQPGRPEFLRLVPVEENDLPKNVTNS